MDLIEIEQMIRPDGQVYTFTLDRDRALLNIGGRGFPPIEYQTMRGYMQQSETVIGWVARPRLISMLVSWENLSREQYWEARQELSRFVRPNLGGDLRLLHTRADGTQREIKVRAEPPVFENDMNWEVMQETLTFTAYDPVFYDPNEKQETFTAVQPTQLAFPITFPISFGDHTIIGSETNIIYGGDFSTWPVIDITGPYSWVQITNLTTDRVVKLGQPIMAGQTRHIDLTPGARRIVDGNGESRFSELILPNSDLLGLNLRPDGIPVGDDPYEGVPSGINTFRVDAEGFLAGVTQVVLRYNERFLSVA